jgi:hypothetical protein
MRRARRPQHRIGGSFASKSAGRVDKVGWTHSALAITSLSTSAKLLGFENGADPRVGLAYGHAYNRQPTCALGRTAYAGLPRASACERQCRPDCRRTSRAPAGSSRQAKLPTHHQDSARVMRAPVSATTRLSRRGVSWSCLTTARGLSSASVNLGLRSKCAAGMAMQCCTYRGLTATDRSARACETIHVQASSCEGIAK